MNTHPVNPFSGLKAALAGLMSGGWLGLLLTLLVYRRVAAALAALEGLFAQWQAGTLPLPAAPARAAGTPAAAPAPARRRAGAGGRTPAARAAAPQMPAVAGRCAAVPSFPAPPPHAVFALRAGQPWNRRGAEAAGGDGRCRKNAAGRRHACTP
jgi:hypothetical protein